MTSAKAILAGAVLIAASIVFVQTIRPAAAQYEGGNFSFMHHSNTAANASIFRVNNSTGAVSYCYVPATSSVEVVCTQPTR